MTIHGAEATASVVKPLCHHFCRRCMESKFGSVGFLTYRKSHGSLLCTNSVMVIVYEDVSPVPVTSGKILLQHGLSIQGLCRGDLSNCAR